jgi:hypothetical protein
MKMYDLTGRRVYGLATNSNILSVSFLQKSPGSGSDQAAADLAFENVPRMTLVDLPLNTARRNTQGSVNDEDGSNEPPTPTTPLPPVFPSHPDEDPGPDDETRPARTASSSGDGNEPNTAGTREDKQTTSPEDADGVIGAHPEMSTDEEAISKGLLSCHGEDEAAAGTAEKGP